LGARYFWFFESILEYWDSN